MCFKDLVFIVTWNRSAIPCETESSHLAFLSLYSILAIVTGLELIHGFWGSWKTQSKVSRNHLLACSMVSILFLIMLLLILTGHETGEEGVVVVVFFGLTYFTFDLVMSYGLMNLKILAQGSLRMYLGLKKKLEFVASERARRLEAEVVFFV